MCGRYASSRKPEDLVEEFEISAPSANKVTEALAPDYNVAPTKPVYAVMERSPSSRDEPEPEPPQRQLRVLSWGLVPSWAKDPSIGSRMINARLETVAEKPAYAKAFRARRCLLPADGFYEWYTAEQPATSGGRPGKPRKQPFFLHRADGGLLVMAGIYEIWRDPTKDREDDDAWLRTCSVITTRATDAAGHIHDRMPMVVPRDAIDQWLDPALTEPGQALALLSVTEAAALEAYSVSTAVNSVQNNDPSLLLPLAETDGPVAVPAEQDRLL